MTNLPTAAAAWVTGKLSDRRTRASLSADSRPSRAPARIGGPRTLADTDNGQSRGQPAGGASLAFRYRYQLAPGGAVAVLALVAEVGHLASSRGWLWGALAVLVAAALVAFTRDRGEERWYGLGAGAGAAIWVALAWALGIGGPLAVALLVVGTVAAIPWWRHHSVRGRIRVVDGTWKPWERERWAYTRESEAELRRIYGDWSRVSADARIPCEIIAMVADRHSFSIHVRLASGVEFQSLVGARGKIESALDAKRSAVSIEPEEMARRAVLRWSRSGAPRPDLSWPEPEPGRGFFDPIVIGEYEDRTPLLIDTDREQNPHVLIAGDSGAGKTSLMAALVVEWGWRPDTFVWVFDAAKRGAGYRRVANAISRTVYEPGQVVPALQALTRIAAARADYLGAHGLSQWPTSPSHPQIVVPLDETSQMLAERGALKEVLALARLGRQLGIALVLGTQRPSGEALGDSTELRGLMRLRLGLHVNEAPDSELVFGRGALTHGWNAAEIPIGWCMPKSPEHLTPRKAHLLYLDPTGQVERNAAMPAQPALDPVSADAEQIAAQRVIVAQRPAPAQVAEPARPAGPPQVASIERQDEIADLLDVLEQALRELGPTASLRALSVRICGDASKKTWISDKGLPALVAQGRVVGEPGDWRVVGLQVVADAEGGSR